MMPHERRLSTRKTPKHFAYLSLPMNNGGIVVDVSEGGLGFRAIAPVEADGPIHFRFAIDSDARISAVGELAWKDETGKIGGLRFTELSDEAREQIRVWASQNWGAIGRLRWRVIRLRMFRSLNRRSKLEWRFTARWIRRLTRPPVVRFFTI